VGCVSRGKVFPGGQENFKKGKEASCMEKTFFDGEEWYRGLDSPELVFEGVVRKKEAEARLQVMRHNPWSLEGPEGFIDIYLGSHAHQFEEFRDKAVRITGKRLEFELEGSAIQEIAPGKVSAVE
jgi:hypothetical protein